LNNINSNVLSSTSESHLQGYASEWYNADLSAGDNYLSTVQQQWNVEQAVKKDFQRTPRAPKTAKSTVQPRAVSDAQKKLAVIEKDFTFFEHSQSTSGNSPTTQLGSNHSVTPTARSEPREKIPPAPESSIERKVAQRQKQIDIGKNTPEYYNYRRLVPRKSRRKNDPASPDKYQIISKRNWEGQLKAWRRRLHEVTSSLVGYSLLTC
jgi:hypothetical protein